ncbi:MAG: caspase family protein, partial [Rhodomicrobium sp.]
MLRAAAILAGLWLCVGVAAAQEPVRLALLIGNQGYAPSVGVLKNPHNDIAIVGEALRAQGFTLLPPVKDATRVQILGAIRELVRRLNQAGSGAIGFVYYSGHGAAEAQTNVNYLIPVDAQKPGTEAFWDEAVKLDEVLKLLSGASGAAKFVVFDACRNELRLPYRGAKGFEPVREQPGLFVAYTTAPGQPASDEGERSGPYAAALAAELGKPGVDHLHLFQRVKEAVYASTKGAQQPWESNGLFRLVYLTPAKKEAEPAKAPGQAARAGPLPADAQAWSLVQNSQSEAVLEEFARRFPNSVYADFAKARLEELKANKAASWWSSWSSDKPAEAGKPQDAQAAAAPAKPAFAPKDTQVAVVAPPAPAPAVPAELACDGLLVAVAHSNTRPCIRAGSGKSFQDCPDCPEMVIAPAGSFTMGSPASEPERSSDEGPQHEATIGEPFAVGRFAVTRDEFEAFVKDSGHGLDGGCYVWSGSEWKQDSAKSFRSPGFAQTGSHPVVCVNWNDAQAYVAWLS